MADEHLISLQPGTVIAGRYEVVKCLGAGSMGLVYACRHRELSGHLVAVKVLFPEVARDKVAAARFRNEIFASYGVSHPNVVRAYEYIRDGDLVAYTMEYVGGGALADRLEKGDAALSINEILRILSQMCAGVQAIHDAGIVHRDLKPENILLAKDGQVKIADFGIAKAGHGPKLTEHGGVVGTIEYVSPEYMLNSQVDWRSDIYAMGILGYEMTTGEAPFSGDSVYAKMTKRLKTDPKPPSSVRPDCPRSLDAIILKAMARDPEARYQSASDMFYDLQAAMNQTPANNNSSTSDLSGRFRIPAQTAPAYVGPIAESPELSGDQEKIDHSSGAWAVSAPDSHIQQRESSQTNEYSYHTDAPTVGFTSRNTTVINGELQQLADSYEDSEPEQQLESVLGSGRDRFQGWGDNSRPREVSVSGAFDHQRIRKLSEIADATSSSVWGDIAILVIAVLIGIGVGLAVLKVFFPDVVRRDHSMALYYDADYGRS